MDGNQGPDVAPAAAGTVLVTDVARTLAAVRPSRDGAGLIGQLRDLEDLKSAAASERRWDSRLPCQNSRHPRELRHPAKERKGSRHSGDGAGHEAVECSGIGLSGVFGLVSPG